ncbi:hypothetical protein B0H13DRAFT_1897859 [Mycena leptocephala]|nr:hypothetical protein B0H13DRAFT_1897859 [Mycena leptocephala]
MSVRLVCSLRKDSRKLTGSRGSYCFDLDSNEGPEQGPPEAAYSVDTFASGSERNSNNEKIGNWTPFINHSCSPNTRIISVTHDTTTQDNMPYLAFVASGDIPAYTEITFDYNPALQEAWESRNPHLPLPDDNEVLETRNGVFYQLLMAHIGMFALKVIVGVFHWCQLRIVVRREAAGLAAGARRRSGAVRAHIKRKKPATIIEIMS